MALLEASVPIESADQLLRARRTAALTRIVVGICAVGLILTGWHGIFRPAPALAGFAVVALTALVQLAAPRLSWLTVEESLSTVAALLIIGVGNQHVGVLAVLWLVAVASGVLARGGRAHWLGRTILLAALALPIARYGAVSGEYAAFCVVTVGLLLTSGRVTSELNLLLAQARVQAEQAETLLYAGDLAARVSGGVPPVSSHSGPPAREDGVAPVEQADRAALARALRGEGLSMAVQPIVDVRTGAVHAYEALARFERHAGLGGPLDWFSLAQELGERARLERACLALGLALFARRPFGTSVSVNLSAPVLLEPATALMLSGKQGAEHDLAGLIIEITEETLVHGDMNLAAAIDPLRARGAQLAVDDVGAGYSGLRQIMAVSPGYLKLDRSLITGIDHDNDRAALVGALAGYSEQVGALLVAEGVETQAELRAVKRLGVPLVQGFYLARPGEPWPEPGVAELGEPAAHPAAVQIAAEERLVRA
jgi:EAL domain-containing protein (putative c-di-GMP-specific phosphodiesterase class I)